MKERWPQKENIQLGELIQNRNYVELEKWIGNDHRKAREVFCQYKSLKALQEIEEILFPSVEERNEILGKRIKRVVIALVNQCLQLLESEDHRLFELGITRAKGEDTAFNFGKFRIEVSGQEDAPYTIKLGKCEQVSIKVGEKKLYEGKKISRFSLSLQPGIYHIQIDLEQWELELK